MEPAPRSPQDALRREPAVNPTLLGAVHKSLLIRHVIFRQGDKQPIGRFNTVAGDAAQNAVLTDAFAGGFVVGHRVAGAAVQQSMIMHQGNPHSAPHRPPLY